MFKRQEVRSNLLLKKCLINNQGTLWFNNVFIKTQPYNKSGKPNNR